jgi:DNA-directed RNA polymerase II subunit RPB1
MVTRGYEYNDTREITRIEFKMLDNNFVLKMSALGKDTKGVSVADLYDNLEPKKDGLIDARMGTTDYGTPCDTCGLDFNLCVGHFGHIVLAEPVFHIGYLNYLKKILSCICLRCSKILSSGKKDDEEEMIKMLKIHSGKYRLSETKNKIKNVTKCSKANNGCNTPVSVIKLDSKKTSGAILLISETTITSSDQEEGIVKKKVIQKLTPDDCYNILKNISDADCMLLGLDPKKCRPESMIYKIFPVSPVQVRPSARTGVTSAMVMEDQLTHKLADIVKANNRVYREFESNNENSMKYSQDYKHLLQCHVANYVDNESIYIPKCEQKGKLMKSLTSRIKSKHGRVRYNLMGKRVDFSARTVITADPTISINQLGVPIKIAMNLTFPEIVTSANINKLKILVRNGRYIYPGANFVFPISQMQSGRGEQHPIDLRFRKDKVDLRIGDIVERHMIDDDIVLLNRQPTLHKHSMMGHKVKIINNPLLNTFRLSVAATGPYNADFDGDEMNIFFPQSKLTQIELEEIVDVKKIIISPSSSNTIIGLVQDGIIGSYTISSPDTKISWKNAMNLLSYTNFNNFDKVTKKDYNGLELMSFIIPNNINVTRYSLDLPFRIKHGILTEGRLSKETMSTKSNNIIQYIWDEYGPGETQKFIDDSQRLINNYNLLRGFTVGINDIYAGKDYLNDVSKIIESKDVKIRHLITEYENNPDLMSEHLLEVAIFSTLNPIREDVSKLIMEKLDDTNNFNVMIKSGAKGKEVNMGQICGCVGLQAFQQKLIPKIYNNRTLPYFFENDDTLESRGMIKRSYSAGMEVHEFFYHNMTGREGLIDTAIKTSESGYIQRRLIKSMEDAMIRYDCTVRTANNTILQFIYGDSGLDSTNQYKYKFKLMEMGNKQIESIYKFTDSEISKFKNYSKIDNNKYYDKIIIMRNSLRENAFKYAMSYLVLDMDYMIPVNFKRLIDNAINNTDSTDRPEPHYIINEIEKLLKPLYTPLGTMTKKSLANTKSMKYIDDQLSKIAFRYALYDVLAPKRCILEYKINKKQFDNIISNIIQNYNKNIAEPGEMVGLITAQSLGQPTTQMTLDTFHATGIASVGTTTDGVPRVNELLSISKNIKFPKMTIYFDDDYITNKTLAHKVASYIEFSTIKDLRNKIDVYYDPLPYDKDGIMEQDNVVHTFYSQMNNKNSCVHDISTLPWLLRISFDREKLMEKEVTLLDIKTTFCSWWEKRFTETKTTRKEEKLVLEKISQCGILSNTDYDLNPIIHIRFDLIEFETIIVQDFVHCLIDKIKLKGLNNITKIEEVVEKKCLGYNNDDQVLEKNMQYWLRSAGINLYDIRYIKGINIYKTICNDAIAVYDIFGIEAARSILLHEIIAAYGGSGFTINYNHLTILVDIMTSNGNLVSIDRHGMNKLDTDPLSRASFEKTVEQLFTAAVFSEVDHMKGISSRIMAGLVIKGGTGYCDLILDIDMLHKSEYIENMAQKYNTTFSDLEQNVIINDVSMEEIDGFVPDY